MDNVYFLATNSKEQQKQRKKRAISEPIFCVSHIFLLIVYKLRDAQN